MLFELNRELFISNVIYVLWLSSNFVIPFLVPMNIFPLGPLTMQFTKLDAIKSSSSVKYPNSIPLNQLTPPP